MISKKLFAVLWRRIDQEEPPQPEHRRADLGKLAFALVLEGALSASSGVFSTTV